MTDMMGVFPVRSELSLLSIEEFFQVCIRGCHMIVEMDRNIMAPILNIMTKDDGKFYDNMVVLSKFPEPLRPLIAKKLIEKMNAVACVIVNNPKTEDGEEHLTFSMQTLAGAKYKAYRVCQEPFALELDDELEEPVEDAAAWAGLMLPPMRYEQA